MRIREMENTSFRAACAIVERPMGRIAPNPSKAALTDWKRVWTRIREDATSLKPVRSGLCNTKLER